jgi:hypothetical protein
LRILPAKAVGWTSDLLNYIGTPKRRKNTPIVIVLVMMTMMMLTMMIIYIGIPLMMISYNILTVSVK